MARPIGSMWFQIFEMPSKSIWMPVDLRVAIATSLGKPQAKERSCTEFPDVRSAHLP